MPTNSGDLTAVSITSMILNTFKVTPTVMELQMYFFIFQHFHRFPQNSMDTAAEAL
jgi:hypothetical protein